MSTVGRSRVVGSTIAVVGSALGALAGVVQLTIGSRIPDWTGNKAEPVALGALTILLSGVAAIGARRLRSPRLQGGRLLGAAALIVVPALICFTTVGRLWIVPGTLLLVGAIRDVDDWRAEASTVARNWMPILLVAVGGCQLLMALRATPVVMALGLAGGAAIIAAGAIGRRHRALAVGLVVGGTVPFAIAGWSALVPVLVLVVAVPLTVVMLRPRRAEVPGDGHVRAVGRGAPLAKHRALAGHTRSHQAQLDPADGC